MFKIWLTTALLGLLLLPALAPAADEVVVYSARKEHLIKPLFDRYTQLTDTKISYITDKAGPLLARLQAEGRRTPADMLITVDAGNLWQAAEAGVLAELDSETLAHNVPGQYRDPGNRWFGMSVRARTIAYNSDKLKPTDLSTYEDLADPKWRGRLCLRTAKKVYNQSLVATLIARHGEEQAEAIVKGWVANLATPPFSNDTKTLKAVAAGRCDVAIVNTYYFGRLKEKEPQIPLALFWPNQQTSGVHVNVSGAGITQHAKHPEAAVKLLEWLSGEEAQGMFGGLNKEYPVNPNVDWTDEVKAWGEFKADDLNVSTAGKLQRAAIQLMDRAGYR